MTQDEIIERNQSDLRKILSLPEGRRYLWRLLESTKIAESIFETSSKIYYNAGKQDMGHFLVKEICYADEAAYFLMLREAMDRGRTEEVRADAEET